MDALAPADACGWPPLTMTPISAPATPQPDPAALEPLVAAPAELADLPACATPKQDVVLKCPAGDTVAKLRKEFSSMKNTPTSRS